MSDHEYTDEQIFAEKLRKAGRDMQIAGAAMMAGIAKTLFSHRNGETAPPTRPGWYWFDGKTPERMCILRVWVEDGEPMVNVTFLKEGYSRHVPAVLHEGQWWGPVTPPWEAE
jgi:hypothetical protein